jgi:hypothetical protein
MYIFLQNLPTMNILDPIFNHTLFYDFREWSPRIFGFTIANIEILGACNTLLERYFQDLSSSILKAPKFLKL